MKIYVLIILCLVLLEVILKSVKDYEVDDDDGFFQFLVCSSIIIAIIFQSINL